MVVADPGSLLSSVVMGPASKDKAGKAEVMQPEKKWEVEAGRNKSQSPVEV